MKDRLFALKILWNYIPCVIGVLLYSLGGMIDLFVIIPLIFVLSSLNYDHSKTWWHSLVLQINLLISSVAGVALSGMLYLKYVSDDVMGASINLLLCILAFVLGVILGISVVIKKYRISKR